jgi:hypothetical protein
VLRAIKDARGDYNLDWLRETPTPDARQFLLGLPGIGPKCAAIVLCFALGRPVIPVDTHVFRVSWRLGLIPKSLGEAKAHDALEAIIPEPLVYRFHVALIRHGRAVCKAQNPAVRSARCKTCAPIGRRRRTGLRDSLRRWVVATPQATRQAWRVAFYLEGCRWRNSLRRSLRNPIGLADLCPCPCPCDGSAGMGVVSRSTYWIQPSDPSQRIWLEASPQERRQMSLLYLLIGAAFHLGVVVVWLGFRPYQFLRGFSESDLHFLLTTPVPAWRLMRALLVIRTTFSLGILVPFYFVVRVADGRSAC